MPKPSAADLARYETLSWWPSDWKQPPAPETPPPPHPQPAAEVVEAFKDWRPTTDQVPAADDGEKKLPDPQTMAMRLLRQLSESPLVLASVRVAARRYLKKLALSSQAPDEPDDEDDNPEADEDFRPVPAPAF